MDKNQVLWNSHNSKSIHSRNTLQWWWNWEDWKNWKFSEFDKSDLIVSVVPQLLSFFEQSYQFDYEYWRFEKERHFDYSEKIIRNEKKNKPWNDNWIHLYHYHFMFFETFLDCYWLKMIFQQDIKFQQIISLKSMISERW